MTARQSHIALAKLWLEMDQSATALVELQGASVRQAVGLHLDWWLWSALAYNREKEQV